MTTLVGRQARVIEWGDCDPAGIVFYPRYFAHFDACTALLFQQALGETQAAWAARHGVIGIPMVDTRAQFTTPCTFGDQVVVESRVAAFRRSSFQVEHRLLRADGVLAVEAWETRVWAARHPDDPARIRGVAVPAAVVAAFG
ncbi:acyl-CoA thioesterase [Falsiroseomonas selenitidurans]|uniref:Acyl-CoA thioesterase n=1 Tax=Falsiroseomonas selenitidurans TaxID=2716335 RepID=A0ABX1EB46_9PROT|nr:acyl-CoA thioesterase [Falsiroseomonas selenitidurans]NKC32140.1 acyl-CoA thioesterase [Falsiroseomonas selenitidurans]